MGKLANQAGITTLTSNLLLLYFRILVMADIAFSVA